MAERTVDVLVIGAGVAGCGVGWRLAQRGLSVLLVDRGEPGHGASWAAAGMLTPLAEAPHDDALLTLAEEALARWEAFADELRDTGAGDVGWRRSGRMHLAGDAGAADRLRRLAATPAGKRAHAVWLDPSAARSLEPCLSGDIAGAAIFPGDATADPRALGSALCEAALAAGARVRRAEVSAVRRDAEGVSGVLLQDGSAIAARRVVIAAGAWAAQVEGLPASLPIRPVRGEMFAVEAADSPINHILWGEGCYVVPRPGGRILVGATVGNVGFAPGPTPAGIAALARAAERICSRLASLRLLEVWAGYRPGTPDTLPILGADPRLQGLFHAAGLYRNGILLAPVIADEIAATVSGEPAAFDLTPFSPVRGALA